MTASLGDLASIVGNTSADSKTAVTGIQSNANTNEAAVVPLEAAAAAFGRYRRGDGIAMGKRGFG